MTESRRVKNNPLSALLAASEVSPFAKTGGLGDVLGSLPAVLASRGVRVSVVMPAYRAVLQGNFPVDDTGIVLSVPIGADHEACQVLKTTASGGVPLYLLRADRYFDRDGLYGTADQDYPDNAERFVFFSRAVLELMCLQPHHILHAHDWHAALAVVFLKTQPLRYPALPDVKTVMTVHNLGYQGRFANTAWPLLDLDWSLFNYRCLEFYNDINFLKGGIVFADAVTTVSPSYAAEIMTPEQGFGLDGVLHERADRVFGILNGVDYSIWNPDTDPYLARNFSITHLAGKKHCQQSLRQYFHLDPTANAPVIGMVTRLSRQKGLDLVQEAFDRLLETGCQFVLLGTGDSDLQDYFRDVGLKYSGRVGVEIGFRDDLAHRIIAGSDMLLMPSLYEPGGLTQLYGLRYGTIPVVRATGGLKDTVVPWNPDRKTGNGFSFTAYRSDALLAAVQQAVTLFRQPKDWAKLVKNAMKSDFSWAKSAAAYVRIYRRLLRG